MSSKPFIGALIDRQSATAKAKDKGGVFTFSYTPIEADTTVESEWETELNTFLERDREYYKKNEDAELPSAYARDGQFYVEVAEHDIAHMDVYLKRIETVVNTVNTRYGKKATEAHAKTNELDDKLKKAIEVIKSK